MTAVIRGTGALGDSPFAGRQSAPVEWPWSVAFRLAGPGPIKRVDPFVPVFVRCRSYTESCLKNCLVCRLSSSQ